MDALLFQYHLLKRQVFLRWITLTSVLKNPLAVYVRIYFWALCRVLWINVAALIDQTILMTAALSSVLKWDILRLPVLFFFFKI